MLIMSSRSIMLFAELFVNTHKKYSKMTIVIKRSNISSLEKGKTELLEPINIKIFLSI